MDDSRKLRRKIVQGICVSDAHLADKLRLLRAMLDSDTRAKITDAVVTAAAAADLEYHKAEFDWSEFFELIAYLLPLLLELLG